MKKSLASVLACSLALSSLTSFAEEAAPEAPQDSDQYKVMATAHPYAIDPTVTHTLIQEIRSHQVVAVETPDEPPAPTSMNLAPEAENATGILRPRTREDYKKIYLDWLWEEMERNRKLYQDPMFPDPFEVFNEFGQPLQLDNEWWMIFEHEDGSVSEEHFFDYGFGMPEHNWQFNNNQDVSPINPGEDKPMGEVGEGEGGVPFAPNLGPSGVQITPILPYIEPGESKPYPVPDGNTAPDTMPGLPKPAPDGAETGFDKNWQSILDMMRWFMSRPFPKQGHIRRYDGPFLDGSGREVIRVNPNGRPSVLLPIIGEGAYRDLMRDPETQRRIQEATDAGELFVVINRDAAGNVTFIHVFRWNPVTNRLEPIAGLQPDGSNWSILRGN